MPIKKCNSHNSSWFKTKEGEKRGYIDIRSHRELWFHTGTACNLQCPDCLEGSAPGDRRLDALGLEDVIPFVDEAVELGVEKFSFTGGEPFFNKDIDRILDSVLDYRPCLVLTNGTTPLQKRFDALLPLLDKPCEVSFRISLDYPDRKRHDARRGEGSSILHWIRSPDCTGPGFPFLSPGVGKTRKTRPLSRHTAKSSSPPGFPPIQT